MTTSFGESDTDYSALQICMSLIAAQLIKVTMLDNIDKRIQALHRIHKSVVPKPVIRWLQEQAPGAPDLLSDGEPFTRPTWDRTAIWPTSFNANSEAPSMEDITNTLATEQ